MKKLIYSVFTLLIIVTACKKNNSSNDDDTPNANNLLTDPATGWKRVAVIPFDELKTARGTSPYNRMKGFDLQKVGGQFAVLYAQHSLDVNSRLNSDWFFKALVSENATAQPEKINFGAFSSGGSGNAGPYGTYSFYAQFIPGSSTPVFTGIDYTNNHTVLVDGTGKTIAGTPSRIATFSYMTDGEFMAATVPYGDRDTYLWHYKNPPNPIGDFNFTYRPVNIDGNKRFFNIPIKANDGNYYEFSLCSKNGATTFLTTRCRDDRAYGGTPPNYDITDVGTVPDMPQSGLQLLTYDYNSTTGEITFVFTNLGNIHCYRWKQGSLTKLWQASLDGDANFRDAIQVYTNRNMLNEWRIKPDGTFYLMCSSLTIPFNYPSPWIKLWEVNQLGVKVVSTLAEAQTAQKEFTISTCRYIDGAYYALAYPTGDSRYKIGDPHYHMEVIKLNP